MPLSRLVTKRLGPSDLEELRILAEPFFPSPLEDSQVAQLLANPDTLLVGSFEDSRCVGFALAYILRRPESGKDSLFLYEIEVSETHRRQGRARAMIDMLLGIRKENGLCEMFVFTNLSNPIARALYESTGGIVENGDDLLYVYPSGNAGTAPRGRT